LITSVATKRWPILFAISFFVGSLYSFLFPILFPFFLPGGCCLPIAECLFVIADYSALTVIVD